MSRMNPRSSVTFRLHARFGLALPLVSTTLSTRLWPSLFAGFLLLLLLFSYTSTAAAQAPGTFIPTGNMTTPRGGHTATLLLNGKVLITAGGTSRSTSAELYDPSGGTFTATGSMTTSRYAPSATLLADGRVLVAGGDDSGTAELYDPASGTFTVTGHMVTTQYWHTATLLNNGKVLIAGGGRECPNGDDGCLIVDRPELYDPATGTFTPTGDYADKTRDPWFETAGLVGAPATLLPDGKVLMAGMPTAELYDPTTGTFALTGQMTRGASDSEARPPGSGLGGTATLLKNGRVLLAGGNLFEWSFLSDAELYDPSTGKFTAIGSMNKATDGQTATLLPDGTVLVTGGQGWDCIDGPQTAFGTARLCFATGYRIDAELYDPSSGAFKSTNSMNVDRSGHVATLLNDGRVLITGGGSAVAELYIPSVLVPTPVVTGMRFDRTTIVAGGSLSVNISGPNLTTQTFFDVRFTSPGTNESAVVLNWQKGFATSHDIAAGIASGSWTVIGVRAHEIETDHTGNFFPVSATIAVSP